MKRLVQGLPVPEQILLDSHAHLPEALPHSGSELEQRPLDSLRAKRFRPEPCKALPYRTVWSRGFPRPRSQPRPAVWPEDHLRVSCPPPCRALQGFVVKRPLFARLLSTTVLLCGLPLAQLAGGSDPLRFALVAKQADQRFFVEAGEGCAEAARAQGDTCLLLGPSGSSHFRLQNQALEQAIDRGLDGIALSVTHSKWLAEHALKGLGKTPLITFDSDLGPAERYLRRGYVGLDNLAFGRHLGWLAQRFRPHGGRLCILSASPQDTNLQERLKGVRQQLRGVLTAHYEAADRLAGESGWRESRRCPLFNAKDQQSVLLQLTTLLNSGQVDTIISLGSWPTQQADEFRRQLGPLLAELDARGARPVIVIGTPTPNSAQLSLLEEGLVQAYLGVESREIGRQSYSMMKRLAQGIDVPEEVLVDSRVYLPEAPSHGTAEP
nr:substrate-binding domain-containing protein [Azotobacter salinestris]